MQEVGLRLLLSGFPFWAAPYISLSFSCLVCIEAMYVRVLAAEAIFLSIWRALTIPYCIFLNEILRA
jgi:hypothetical protein